MGTSTAQFFDGETAQDRAAIVALGQGVLIITVEGDKTFEWSLRGLRAANPPSPGHPLRLAHSSNAGARLTISNQWLIDEILRATSHLRGGVNSRRLFGILGIAAACLVAVTLVIWALFSYAPQKLAMVMPDSWRNSLGDTVEKSFVEGAAQCIAPEGEAALHKLADRIREGNPDLPAFSLRVYDIPVTNAFALPGGRIVLFRKLVDRAAEADEVAGVLAHEIGHVARRHAETQLIRSVGLQLLLSLATGGGSGGDTVGSFAGLLAILSYSRSAETEADDFGLQTLANAEIDTLGLKRFFEKIAKEEGEPLTGVFGRMGSMMSTHPVTQDRIAAIKPLQGKPRVVLSEADWNALKKICNQSATQ